MKNIKSQSQHSRKRSVILSLLIIFSLLGVTLFFYVIKPHFDRESIDTSEKTLEIKDRPVGEINYDTPTTDEEKPTLDPPVASPTLGSSIPVLITYAAGSPLQVRTLVNDVLSSGTCTLLVKKGNTEITTQKVEVFNSASSSTCRGFTVDSSLVPSGSTYTISVTVESGDRSGSTSKDVIL